MTNPEAAPDAIEPDASEPDASEPDASEPDGSVPDGSVPDGSVPDGRVHDAMLGDGPSLPPPSGVESLVGALLDAGPEVAEHVVRAAQELLLAAQAIVDAADRAVQEQHRLQVDDDATSEAADSDPSGEEPPARVRHLDIAE